MHLENLTKIKFTYNINAMKNAKLKISNFFELTRGYSVLMSVAPWFLTVMWAQIYLPPIKDVFLTFIGIVCVHLGTNLFDDYIDVKKEIKSGKTLKNIDFGAINNKAKLILNGTYSLKQVVTIISVLYAIALIIGIYYTVLQGGWILAIMAISGVLCLLYPFATKFYSGELIVGVIFGPLLMSGTYYALCGLISTRILIMSISVGLLTAALLHTHAIMDWEYDCTVGKNTFCRLFKTKENAIYALKAIVWAAYINVIYFTLTGWLHPNALYALLTLPMAVELFKSIKDYINIKNVKFIPAWWMGPMEDWENIKNVRMDFFMYRFYLARNLCFLFCMIAGIACYLK